MSKLIAAVCVFSVFIIVAYCFSKIVPREGYSNNTLEDSMGDYPSDKVLVQDMYPITGRNGITDNEASDISGFLEYLILFVIRIVLANYK